MFYGLHNIALTWGTRTDHTRTVVDRCLVVAVLRVLGNAEGGFYISWFVCLVGYLSFVPAHLLLLSWSFLHVK